MRDSDLTFLLVPGVACVSPGTELTASFARTHKKPLFGFAVDSETSVKAMAAVCKTMRGHVRLNIAGPRESEHPGIYRTTRDLLARLFLLLARGSLSGLRTAGRREAPEPGSFSRTSPLGTTAPARAASPLGRATNRRGARASAYCAGGGVGSAPKRRNTLRYSALRSLRSPGTTAGGRRLIIYEMEA